MTGSPLRRITNTLSRCAACLDWTVNSATRKPQDTLIALVYFCIWPVICRGASTLRGTQRSPHWRVWQCWKNWFLTWPHMKTPAYHWNGRAEQMVFFMATALQALDKASWGSSLTATGPVIGPAGAQFLAPPYWLEDVFSIHVQEPKSWFLFQVLKQKYMHVPVALQMVSCYAGLLNGWQVSAAPYTFTLMFRSQRNHPTPRSRTGETPLLQDLVATRFGGQWNHKTCVRSWCNKLCRYRDKAFVIFQVALTDGNVGDVQQVNWLVWGIRWPWTHLPQETELAVNLERLELGSTERVQQRGCEGSSTSRTWFACVYSCALFVVHFSLDVFAQYSATKRWARCRAWHFGWSPNFGWFGWSCNFEWATSIFLSQRIRAQC